MGHSRHHDVFGCFWSMRLLVLLISTQVLNADPGPALPSGQGASAALPGVQPTETPMGAPGLRLEIWGDGSVMEVSRNGSLTPFLDSQLLEVGQSYTLRAIPAPGSVFAGWGGDVRSA